MSAAKAVHRLMRTIGALTDGQASVGEVDWDGSTHSGIVIWICPNAGIYQGGKFKFHIELDRFHPTQTPPIVRCLTDILHPNFDTCEDGGYPERSNLCLNLFDEGTWHLAVGLDSIVLGLMFLLDNPNFQSIMSRADMACFNGNEDTWKENVRRYMRGEKVAGTYFDAQFFSNVDGRALVKDTGNNENVATECDVDAMNTVLAFEKACASPDFEDQDDVWDHIPGQGILGTQNYLSSDSLSQTGDHEAVSSTEQIDNDRPFKLVSVDGGFALARG